MSAKTISPPSRPTKALDCVLPKNTNTAATQRIRHGDLKATLSRVADWRQRWERSNGERQFLLCPSVRFLCDAGFDFASLKAATDHALTQGTPAAAEMIAAGQLSRQGYDEALAHAAGVRYVCAADIKAVLVPLAQSALLLKPHGLHWCRLHDDTLCAVAVVDPAQAEFFIGHIRRSALQDRIVVTSPKHFKALVLAKRANQVRRQATDHLLQRAPKDSALAGANFWQGVVLTLFIGVLVAGFILGPTLEALLIHIVLSLFFIACAFMRVGATLHRDDRRNQTAIAASDDTDKPVYTVLVTLLDEVAVVPGLIHHLSRLRWPATKIEIKLICEAHDRATIAALNAQHLDDRFEIIIVPPGGPTTKPNALCYAMAFCHGQFLTLYDAEDRPHPMQLEEAWQRFKISDGRLACLQAPLHIGNAAKNRFTALFHMEYAGLFTRILPWLAARKLPVPLGGTSNHFDRTALEAVGLWDPYNVTEDADIGYKLWAAGYDVGTISLPTIEDAPTSFAVWLPQRTRWFKGWMQTWIVHSRKSRALIARHGLKRFALAHILLTGVILSAVLHPLVLLTAVCFGIWLAGSAFVTSQTILLLAVDTVTLFISYGAFCLLGLRATEAETRKQIGHHAWATPLYWMAMSLAAWRALYQMFAAPFLWEKTPHEAYWLAENDNAKKRNGAIKAN